ncbi:hypothetical protein [Streptomyces sp. NPDC057287]|uniref:hypothetical protein n=1 Tax=Streptomyces sp. NPDC057287 TaxID=3346086 RepID=UPI00362B7B0E
MDDDAVETRSATEHTTWRAFRNDLNSLMGQAGIQQQQIARSLGVAPSTVGRWLRRPTPLHWDRVEQIIVLCLEHADAHGRPLFPSTPTNTALWKDRLESIGSKPPADEAAHPPKPAATLPSVTREPQRLRPNIAMAASPALPTFAILFIGLVATVTVFTFAGPSSAPKTGAPTATSSAPMDRDVAERLDDTPKADRGTPRPTLSPPPGPPHNPAPPPSAGACSKTALPPVLDQLAPVIIDCTPVSVTVLLCPPRADGLPAHPHSAPPCFLLELSSTRSLAPKQ